MSTAATATQKRSPLRSVLRWAGLILLICVLIAAATAGWIWHNRYQLIERQAITYLESIGIEAELSIRSATRTQADIRRIRLSHDGERFLSVDRLQADYQWRDLLNGQVERLDFTGLEASITVDEQGRIVDGWIPPSNPDRSGTSLPSRGIGVSDGMIRLRTPYGLIPVEGDVEVGATDRFTFDGRLGETTLTRGPLTFELSGPVEVSRDRGPFRIALPRTPLSVTHPAGSLRRTIVATRLSYDPQGSGLAGQAELSGGTFDADAGLTGRIERLSLDGRFEGGVLRGDVDAELRDLRVPEEGRRRSVARTLSLAGALADVPVARNFVPGLEAALADLLLRSDLSASVAIELSAERREIHLRAPMRVGGDRTEATLSAVTDIPLYRYAAGSGTYEIDTLATLSRPVPLSLDPLDLTIRTADGLGVLGIDSATGRIRSRTDWRARTPEGRSARLGPLSLGFDYAAPADAPSRLTLRGMADYDGDVPGGYVTGLTAGGRLSAMTSPGRTRVDYQPDCRLSIDRLETSSDWGVEAFEGTVVPRSPVYERRAGRPAAVTLGLSETTLTARRPQSAQADAAALALSVASADLSGSIATDRQDWQIGFEGLGLQSETFPVPGTDLALPSGDLALSLTPEGRTRFDLSTPDSKILTPQYEVRGMALGVSGTAEAYRVDFSGGRVRLVPQDETATVLPVIPASGRMDYAQGRFTGQARANLPAAPDSPFDIDYGFGPHGGEAQITIRNLRFRPGGLQPQDLAPALRGKIARVTGGINADLRVGFGGDRPLNGSGTVELLDMALGTAPGPVTGLSGTVELTSLFPVVTPPGQSLSIRNFDPGFPLDNGRVVYQLVTDGVAISDASFPLGDGQVRFEPFLWTYGAQENRVVLRVSGVEIGDFLRDIGEGRMTATGQLEGTIPVVVRGIDVLVENGRIDVRGGGTISYRSDNPNPNMALRALENFRYEALFAEVNGPLDGDVTLGMIFTGSNPDVIFGTPFQFDVSVEGELFNIARNLNPNGLQDRIISSVTSDVQGRPARNP